MVIASTLTTPAVAQDDDQATELAKKLANPVAELISVPLQYNYDEYSDLNEDVGQPPKHSTGHSGFLK